MFSTFRRSKEIDLITIACWFYCCDSVNLERSNCKKGAMYHPERPVYDQMRGWNVGVSPS